MANKLTGLQFTAFEAVANNDEAMGQAIRDKINEVCGGEWNYWAFMENQYKVYALISQLMPSAENAGLKDKFNRFADFHDVAMGEKQYFDVEDNEIYTLYTCSRGNGDIERRKIVDRKITVATVAKAIKLYAEFDSFMAGTIDLGRLSEKAVTAHINFIGELISDTIYNSYSSVGTDYKATGTFDEATLLGIMEDVKAATGATRLQIWGSVTALSNVSDIFGYSDAQKELANGLGYYGNFRGADLIALPQAYASGSVGTFKVNNNYIIILPADEKIVKVVFEGNAYVGMADGMDRNDEQTEIIYKRRIGAAALTLPVGKYGLYKFA